MSKAEWVVTVQRQGGPVIPKTFTDKAKAEKHWNALSNLADDRTVVKMYGPK